MEDMKEAHRRLRWKLTGFSHYGGTPLIPGPGFLNCARDPKIQKMIEQLIGKYSSTEIQSVREAPENRQLDPIAPKRRLLAQPLATCTVGVPLDDSTLENGCLRSPRSQKEKC